MKPDQLPLIVIFNSLRRDYHLPLGVDDYMIVLRALQRGLNIASRQDIEQLCCTVWAKSVTEKQLIEKLFKQMWVEVRGLPREPDLPPIIDEEKRSNIDSSEVEAIEPSALPDVESLESESTESTDPLPTLETPPSLSLEMNEPTEVVQAIKQGELETNIPLKRLRYSLIRDYFPVTGRQMKQIWRYLRRPVREGIPTELDIDATVQKIGREGMILAPVMMPPLSNRADLTILIDQEGSMVPFHLLSQQLLETAQQSGRLKSPKVFYFHNYPSQYLYRQSTLIEHELMADVLGGLGNKAAILVVSDAGAARGNHNPVRAELTAEWIKQLSKAVRYVAWLNPMPARCWKKTTAEDIAELLPMFEMSREGMSAAIDTLRGRYIPLRKRRIW